MVARGVKVLRLPSRRCSKLSEYILECLVIAQNFSDGHGTRVLLHSSERLIWCRTNQVYSTSNGLFRFLGAR